MAYHGRDKNNNIELILKKDSMEKKRTGIGVFSRASRRGYTGAVKTQVDFLKGKAKKEYMGNGVVKVSNIYDNIDKIPTIEELTKMPIPKARAILKYIKEKHTNRILKEKWNCGDSSVYMYYYRYGVVTPPASYKGIVYNDDGTPVIFKHPNLLDQNNHKKATKSKSKAKSVSDNKKADEKPYVGKVEEEQVIAPVIEQSDISTDTQKEIENYKKLLEKSEQYINELKTKLLTIEKENQNGFKICLNGSFEKVDIENRILNILNTTVEGKRYQLLFQLTEIL